MSPDRPETVRLAFLGSRRRKGREKKTRDPEMGRSVRRGKEMFGGSKEGLVWRAEASYVGGLRKKKKRKRKCHGDLRVARCERREAWDRGINLVKY
jgi:hypothetical protein